MTNIANNVAACNVSQDIDAREQLFNEGLCGPIDHIQVSTECIAQLRGILFDLDPHLYRVSRLLSEVPTEPTTLYDDVVSRWLSRNSVLSKAEVRNSGTGLHAILWFAEPVSFSTDGDRDRWSGIVQVVQAALPIDPGQPGITATTRQLGSTNSRNGAQVAMLKPGEPVTAEEVLELYRAMLERPFATVLEILTGNNRVEPCPICGKQGTRLSGLKFHGQCYDACGKVTLEQLYDLVLAPRRDEEETEA